MFATSHDILNWVLIICALSLTFFISWAVYYLVVATHKAFGIVKRVEKIINKTEDLVNMVHSKAKNSGPYLMLFSEAMKQAINFVRDNKKTRKKDKEQKKK